MKGKRCARHGLREAVMGPEEGADLRGPSGEGGTDVLGPGCVREKKEDSRVTSRS